MKTRTLLKAVLLLSGLFLALGGASAAQAQDYGPPPGISVDNSTVVQGGNVTVRGTACLPGASVTVSMNGSVVGTAVVAADGTWVLTFAVPTTTAPGAYSVSETGCVNGGGQLSTSVTVLGATVTAGTLPYTGSSTEMPIRVGVVLVTAGALLVFAASRRKAATV